MPASPARWLVPALGLVVLLVALALAASPAHARDGGDRIEVRVAGHCGRTSTARLRLRAEDGEIRVDTQVRTPKYGLWRLTVLHERRTALKTRVRATRSARGFERRVVVPDFQGADAVSIRARPPGGETCTASATVPGS